MPGGRPRLSDDVKRARGTFRASRALNSTPAERRWPVRNPACEDLELQNEAVTELQRLWDECLANLIVDGKPNPLIDKMEQIEAVCIDNGVILPTRNGGKSLLHMMALGAIDNA